MEEYSCPLVQIDYKQAADMMVVDLFYFIEEEDVKAHTEKAGPYVASFAQNTGTTRYQRVLQTEFSLID